MGIDAIALVRVPFSALEARLESFQEALQREVSRKDGGDPPA